MTCLLWQSHTKSLVCQDSPTCTPQPQRNGETPLFTSNFHLFGRPGMAEPLQRLEPAGPPQAITPAKLWNHQAGAASPKMKAGEMRGQSLRHLPGRRQHLHKLQMLDLTRRRREAELKRNLHREAKINIEKIKEFSPKNVLDTLQKGNSPESQDLVPAEHNQSFHGDNQGNLRVGGLSRHHDGAELSPGRSSKVDLWFFREPRTRDLFWDTSSTDSEEWEREKKIYHKHPLVRTKTERVSLFNDFLDRDF
ncbi:factor associated with metabolism and energy isoform X2 [Heliangelus exortis]|uniref:factor associated with metabolism and energy isoform X2 n=1 Tax=Heliangelus exortis TaxID=472823 RepID=UPI003A8CC513